MKSPLFILTLVLFSTSVYSQTYNGPEAEINLILENVANFSEHVVNADHKMLGMSYTKDAKIFPSRREIITGREAITAYWEMPEGVRITHHKITPAEITITGNEAYDYGYYEGRTSRADGEASSWRGKYVIVWKKVDGEWKIYLDIWNRVEE